MVQLRISKFTENINHTKTLDSEDLLTKEEDKNDYQTGIMTDSEKETPLKHTSFKYSERTPIETKEESLLVFLSVIQDWTYHHK